MARQKKENELKKNFQVRNQKHLFSKKMHHLTKQEYYAFEGFSS